MQNVIQVPNFYDGLKSIVFEPEPLGFNACVENTMRPISINTKDSSYQWGKMGDLILYRTPGASIPAVSVLDITSEVTSDDVDVKILERFLEPEVFEWFMSDDNIKHIPQDESLVIANQIHGTLLSTFFKDVTDWDLVGILHALKIDGKHARHFPINVRRLKEKMISDKVYHPFVSLGEKKTFLDFVKHKEKLRKLLVMEGWYTGSTPIDWRKARSLPNMVAIANVTDEKGKSIRYNSVVLLDKDGKILRVAEYGKNQRPNDFGVAYIDIAKDYPDTYRAIYLTFGYDKNGDTKKCTWDLFRVYNR